MPLTADKIAWGFAVLCALSAPAIAERTVSGFALPTRRGGGLAERAEHVARLVADRIGARFVEPETLGPAEVDIATLLATARDLETSGHLEEAIATYDPALDAGARAPFAIGQPERWVEAAVARASLALARGEQARARDLLDQLVRSDPGFELTAHEMRPSMRAELARVAAHLGARPDVERRMLGRACGAGIDVLVVARLLPSGSAELLRFDDCSLRARAELTSQEGDEVAASVLAGDPGPRRRDTPTKPAFYRRPWFWVGVVAVGAAVTITGVMLRQEDGGYDVGLHW